MHRPMWGTQTRACETLAGRHLLSDVRQAVCVSDDFPSDQGSQGWAHSPESEATRSAVSGQRSAHLELQAAFPPGWVVDCVESRYFQVVGSTSTPLRGVSVLSVIKIRLPHRSSQFALTPVGSLFAFVAGEFPWGPFTR